MTFDSNTTYFRKAQSGHAYLVSEYDTLASGETLNIHIKNPADSGKRLWVVNLSVSTQTEYLSLVYDVFDSAPSGGTDVEIQNILLDTEDENNDGVATAQRNVSYSATSEHASGTGGGSSAGQNAVGASSVHPPLVIEEGREMVLETENTDGTDGYHVVSALYYERPI